MKIQITKLDKLFGDYIKLKAKGVCQKCGEKKRLEVAHFIGRRNRHTRWREENVDAVCFTCHTRFHEYPYEHVAFKKKQLGEERLSQLIASSLFTDKVDVESLLEYYTEKLKEVKE